MMVDKNISLIIRTIANRYTNSSQARTIHESVINLQNASSDQGGLSDSHEDVFKSLKSRIKFLGVDNEVADIKEQNAFKLFNLEQKYQINELKLRREMIALQKILHPDRFLSETEATEQKATQLSALVNDLCQILRNPYERGKYLLSLITEQSIEKIEESLDQMKLEEDFLSRVMEIQEIAQDYSICDFATLTKLHADVENDLVILTRELDEEFNCKNIENIKQKLSRLKFIANCHKILSSRLDTFSNF